MAEQTKRAAQEAVRAARKAQSKAERAAATARAEAEEARRTAETATKRAAADVDAKLDDADARVDRLTRELVAADERAVAQRVALETAQRRVAKETNRADAAAKTAARRTGELEDAREEIATLRAAVRLAGGGAAEEREASRPEEREASRRVDRVSHGGDANAARAETERPGGDVFPKASARRVVSKTAVGAWNTAHPPSLRLRLRVAVPFPGAARTLRGRGRKRRRTRSGRVVPGSAGARLGVPVPPGVGEVVRLFRERVGTHAIGARRGDGERDGVVGGYQAGTRGGRVVGGVDAIVVADAVGALGRRRVVSRMVSETGKRERGEGLRCW